VTASRWHIHSRERTPLWCSNETKQSSSLSDCGPEWRASSAEEAFGTVRSFESRFEWWRPQGFGNWRDSVTLAQGGDHHFCRLHVWCERFIHYQMDRALAGLHSLLRGTVTF
jgi:hypothetical protein